MLLASAESIMQSNASQAPNPLAKTICTFDIYMMAPEVCTT